ncbi:SusC/RagA family TonB-linked outer membrane protein [Chitinophaga sp. 22620]|uniref:SusC/RagA family TonB-linked outer membrane protein n=1 Tax=Chitinophaga sp. 22620 TaxID=3453952 RepID=UPI003F83CDC1
MQKVYSLLRKNIRWRAVSLIFMAVQSNAFAAAQDSSNVSLNFTNQPIENVFIALEKQTGYTVFFSGSTLDGNTPITVKVSQVTLSNALAAVLRGKNITWTIKHKGIVLSKKPVAADAPAEPVNLADTVPLINVSGVVVDAKGNPIPAATVSLKGYPRGQGTDNMGRFSFTRVPGNGTLVFSSLGYDPKQVRIGGRGEIRVALDSAIRDIQGVEVVSTGYQNIPKERATGSFVQLGNEIINRNPSSNILDRIINVTSSLKFEPVAAGGSGGNETSISIRGFSTINSNMKPLIVIDGFPYEEYNNPLNQSSLLFNPLNNINPNDIESITVLRDAAAASIWGTRSGNGVIVITTKKGNFNQKPRVEFRSNLVISEKPDLKKLKIVSSQEMVEFERNIFKSGYYNPYDDLYPLFNYYPAIPLTIETLLLNRKGKISDQETEKRLNELSNHDVRDDIDKYFLRNELTQQYNVNISGGNDRFTYYSSFGYDDIKLSNRGNESKRLTFRLDNTYKITKNLEAASYIQFTKSQGKNNGFDYNSLLATGSPQASPYAQLADVTGNPLHVPSISSLRMTYLDTLSGKGLLDWHYRPLDEQKLRNNISNFFTTRLGGNIRYKITSYMNVDIKGQYERGIDNTDLIQDVQTFEMRNSINRYMFYDASGTPQYPIPMGGSITSVANEKTAWNLRGQLNLSKTWDMHQINGLVGIEAAETKRDYSRTMHYGYDPNKSIFSRNINYGTAYPTRPGGISPIFNQDDMNSFLDRSRSYFGNMGYTFMSKYILTLSGRIDESNFFGSKSNDRKVPLYSAGASWNISSEPFYNINWMPYLKLRGTLGYNGNMNNKATSLPTARYVNGTSYNLHTEPVLQLLTAANPGLSWEKIKVVNLGIDFEMLKNRINGSIEYYTKEGINLIGIIPIESTRGVSSYTTNYANLKGKGLDVILNTVNINGDFKWASTLLLSYNTDKITHYTVDDYVKNNIQHNISYAAFVEGKPLLKLYSYPFAGLDPQTGDPMALLDNSPVSFKEFMSNGKVSDLKYAGPGTPQVFGSFLNTFTYKFVSLSCNITYKFNYYLRRQTVNYYNLVNKWGGHSDYVLRWKKPGDELTTSIPSQPAAPSLSRDLFFANSDFLIFKGDHIRLQDLRLNFDLSQLTFKSENSKNLQLYLYANNLGIIWRKNKYDIDPDYPNFTTIPPSKSIAIGLVLGL